MQHTLCWIHAERGIAKLVGFSDEQRLALDSVRTQIWDLYADLKAYRAAPNSAAKAHLASRFDAIVPNTTCFASLNQALKRLSKKKAELLLVLERPEIPLHNNLSERDIREYVKKRKISGSTRSDGCRRRRAGHSMSCRYRRAHHLANFHNALRICHFGKTSRRHRRSS